MVNKIKENYLKKELYELIRTDENIFDFIQESSLDGLWYWDLESPENEWMNPKFWSVLGYNPDEMSHKSSTWQYIINQDDLKVAIDNFTKHCENPNYPYDQVVRYTHKKGSVVWIRCRGLAIRNKNGKAVRMLGAHHDISDIKNREQTINRQNKELLQLNADKDRFISILGHDLRNIFNNTLGFSELLLKKINSTDIDKIEKYAQQINQSTQLAFNLLEDLLTWANAQSGKLAFNPIKLDVKSVCKDVIDSLRSNANKKNISIKYIPTHDLIVFADNYMLKTVIRNLIANAIKYTNSGGNIAIDAEQSQSIITISVTDNGVGMSGTAIDKLFDVTQTHSTPGTANERGTGLGLLLCKEFLEKHGGIIWVESEVGKGTIFKFSIPFHST